MTARSMPEPLPKQGTTFRVVPSFLLWSNPMALLPHGSFQHCPWDFDPEWFPGKDYPAPPLEKPATPRFRAGASAPADPFSDRSTK